MKRLTLSLALLIAVAGSGFGAGTFIGTTVEVGPQPVLAATYYAPNPVLQGGWMHGRVTVGGHGRRLGMVCLQKLNGGVLGCRSITTSDATITFWSYQTGACGPVRSYAEVNGLGAVTSNWLQFC